MTPKNIAFTNVLLMQVINISDVAPLVVVSSLSTTRRGAPGSCGPPRGGVSSEYHREGGLRVTVVATIRNPKYSFSTFQIFNFLTKYEKRKMSCDFCPIDLRTEISTKRFKNFFKMFEIVRLSVHCIYLCKRCMEARSERSGACLGVWWLAWSDLEAIRAIWGLASSDWD